MEKITDKDKKQHFLVCLVASIFSPLFALGLSLGKEYGDKNAIGNHWCWLDLAADALGIIAGGVLHAIVVWWLRELNVLLITLNF